MTQKYTWIENDKEIAPEGERTLFEGLNRNSALKKQMKPIIPFSIFVKDAQGNIVAGDTGTTIFGALYVDMLWVHETLRNQGLGKKLMHRAEEIAHQRGCSFAVLNTMDWEGLKFYQKLGYQIEFTRKGFENQSEMYMLRKKL